jgi:hypothetical protein
VKVEVVRHAPLDVAFEEMDEPAARHRQRK